ncbi:hypothetical protein SISNIDRAFT_461057 [Sistotremastrum niveocremeum HHB9708]|uniref:Major facilitator superfamily (MFS) profile domain-containing protein n=1 Tax=Sistotremastrum niveocremeum HHB9708 TaxID=1314777 RepID=A0A164N0B8_9AGAM|nr:hypothetical protein SISNIDRAFT_461057 [Sistotremastrum niveocremeum HHB9708]
MLVSPPEVVGLANGIAQSIVSLARFLGPVLGGYVSRCCMAYPALSNDQISFGLSVFQMEQVDIP